MWRGTAARSLSSKLLPCRATNPNPKPPSAPRFPPSPHPWTPSGLPSFDDGGFVGRGAAALLTSRLHSSSDRSSKPVIGRHSAGARESIGFSVASPAEAAAVLGSLGSASSSASGKGRDASAALRHYGRCYWELSKARLSMLVVATSGAGFVLGSGNVVDFAGLCYTCAGTMMVAASANSLNQVFEIQNDAKMKRTRQRPLPSGRLSVPHAAVWASSIGIAGTTLLAWKANYLAGGLAACNLVLYAFVYTPLKQIHPVNTWVGAVVGAIPPLLGWAAASGEVSLNAMILPAALYFWQIPHFMALAYLCRNDYIAGGFQMFSLADASGQRTAWVSFRNCLYLLPLGLLAYDWGLTSKWFTLESSLLTLCMTVATVLFLRDRTTRNARRMFHSSLLYLPVFMSGLLLHRVPNDQQESVLINSSSVERLLEPDIQVHEDGSGSLRDRWMREAAARVQGRPPVAYASAAPFPFLPAPLYASADS